MTVLTKEQQQDIKSLYERAEIRTSYLSFRRQARYNHIMECVMLPWCGMLVGIERDGYIHS